MWELFSFGKFRSQTNITKLTKRRKKKKVTHDICLQRENPNG